MSGVNSKTMRLPYENFNRLLSNSYEEIREQAEKAAPFSPTSEKALNHHQPATLESENLDTSEPKRRHVAYTPSPYDTGSPRGGEGTSFSRGVARLDCSSTGLRTPPGTPSRRGGVGYHSNL